MVDAAQQIALIRDLFLIAASIVFMVIAVPVAVLYFRMFRTMHRAAQNLESISSTVLDQVVRPLSSLAALMGLVERLVGLVLKRPSPERSEADGKQ